MFLDPQEKRSLWILIDGPAHEVEGQPIKSLIRAVNYGLAEYTPYQKIFERGKWWNQREVLITEKGKRFLKELP